MEGLHIILSGAQGCVQKLKGILSQILRRFESLISLGSGNVQISVPQLAGTLRQDEMLSRLSDAWVRFLIAGSVLPGIAVVHLRNPSALLLAVPAITLAQRLYRHAVIVVKALSSYSNLGNLLCAVYT